jgi:hypothetical protein
MRYAVWMLVALGCNEYSLREPPPVAPAEPPGKEDDDEGVPPDWQSCFQGFHGEYSNLSIDHPDVEPRRDDLVASEDPSELDWWAEPSFQRFDPSLDMGTGWYPVDEGLEADPAYFAVRWRAWVRAWSNTTMTVSLGAADDAWVIVDGDTVVSLPGIKTFAPATYEIPLSGGQYPMEILYAHRSADSAFRMRVVSGDVTICHPEWEVSE